MTELILLLLFFSVMCAWGGKREMAISCFAVVMIFSVILFFHHITASLAIQL